MPDATTYAQLRRFGRAIREGRTALGLSQEDFAELAELHRTYVGKIERAEVNLSFENMIRLSRALKCKPSALWLRAGL